MSGGTGLDKLKRRVNRPVSDAAPTQREFINEAGRTKTKAGQRSFTLTEEAIVKIRDLSRQYDLYNQSQMLRNIIRHFRLNKDILSIQYRQYISDRVRSLDKSSKVLKKFNLEPEVMEDISRLRKDMNVDHMSNVVDNLICFFAHLNLPTAELRIGESE